MIRINHARLPEGMQAVARHENGSVVVYVGVGLSAGARADAIRRVLRAGPEAGWRPPRSPVLFPALAGAAGLRLVPGNRWTYWAVYAAVAAGAAVVIALALATAMAGGPRSPGTGSPPAALGPSP
jgi:hypothetical protein